MDSDLVQALVKAIELKDLSTAAHTWRVVLYARAMMEHHGVDHETIKRATVGAALHDIGKLDIPDAILQKPGPLDDSEFAIIKTHAALGHDRLVRMGESDEIILRLVRLHHERWDGLGYPDALKGEDIPVGPRFFAVIDSFDAMTSIRPYRREIGQRAAESALAELHAGVGSRYCGQAVDMFLTLYRQGAFGWIREYFNDSCPLPDYAGAESSEKVMREKRGR